MIGSVFRASSTVKIIFGLGDGIFEQFFTLGGEKGNQRINFLKKHHENNYINEIIVYQIWSNSGLAWIQSCAISIEGLQSIEFV